MKKKIVMGLLIAGLCLLFLYVIYAALPTHNNPVLNSTLGYNTTAENLTVYNVSTADTDNDGVTNIVSWYIGDYPKLILYYEFEGGTNSTYTKDYSGRGFDAIGQNAAFSNTSDGLGFGVANFTNNNLSLIRYYNASGSGNLRFNDSYTIEVRFQTLRTASSTQNIVTKTLTTGFSTTELRLLVRTTGTLEFDMGNGTGSITLNTGLSEGKWHDAFVLVDRSQNRTILFVDQAERVNTSFNFRNIYHTANPIMIGQVNTPTSTAQNFNGSIAYVRIWNGTLSSEQMKILSDNNTKIIDNSIILPIFGSVFNASITPNDHSSDGTTKFTTSVTIRSNPIQETPLLNSTYGGNNTDENFTVKNVSTLDVSNSFNYVKPVIVWYKNGNSMLWYNFPFETGSTSAISREFVSGRTNLAVMTNVIYNAVSGFDGNGSYIFNGAGNAISIINTPTAMSSNLTFELWFNYTGAAIPEGNRVYIISKGNGTSAGFGVWIDSTTNKINAAINNTYFNGTTIINNNTWNYLVFAINQTNATLYVNNRNEASGGHTGISSVAVNLTIGSNENLSGLRTSFFNGSIDEVRIWNVTFTTDQVSLVWQNKTTQLNGNLLSQGDLFFAQINNVGKFSEGETKNSSVLQINWYNITLLFPTNGTSTSDTTVVNYFNVTTPVTQCDYFNNDTSGTYAIRATNINIAANHNSTINRTNAPNAVVNILWNVRCMTRGNTTFFAPQNFTIHFTTPALEFFEPLITNTTTYIRNNVTINISCADRVDIQKLQINISNSTGEIISQFANTTVGGIAEYNPYITRNLSNNASGIYRVQTVCSSTPTTVRYNVSFYYGFINASYAHPQTPTNVSFVKGTQTINVTAEHISNNVSSISIYIDGTNRTTCSNQLWCNLTLNVSNNLSIGIHGFNATVTDVWGNVNQTELRNISTHINYTVNDTYMDIRFANETAFSYDVTAPVTGDITEIRYLHNGTISFNNSALQNMSTIIYVFSSSRLSNNLSTRNTSYDNASVDGSSVNVTFSVYTSNVTIIINRTANDGILIGAHYFTFSYSVFENQALSTLNITTISPPTPANASFLSGIKTFNYTVNITNSAVSTINISVDGTQQAVCIGENWCNLTLNVSSNLSVGLHSINATVTAEDGAFATSPLLNFSTSPNYTINSTVMGIQFGIEQTYTYGSVQTDIPVETRYRYNGTINIVSNATQNLTSIIYIIPISRLIESFGDRNQGFDHAEVDGDTTNVSFTIDTDNVTIVTTRRLNQGIHYFQFNYSTYISPKSGGTGGGIGSGNINQSSGYPFINETYTYFIHNVTYTKQALATIGATIEQKYDYTLIILGLHNEYIQSSTVTAEMFLFYKNISIYPTQEPFVVLLSNNDIPLAKFEIAKSQIDKSYLLNFTMNKTMLGDYKILSVVKYDNLMIYNYKNITVVSATRYFTTKLPFIGELSQYLEKINFDLISIVTVIGIAISALLYVLFKNK